jgi:DNA-directed RNA polymerase specialized sigma24 family protein
MDGDAPIDLAPIHEAAADAPPLSEKKIARARRYADSLAEPQRTMFAQYLDGMTAAQIAESMSLKPKAVAKSLAKAYVSLNAILNHMSNGGD